MKYTNMAIAVILLFAVAVLAVISYLTKNGVMLVVCILAAPFFSVWLYMTYSKERRDEDDYYYALRRVAELFWPFLS